MVPHRQAEFGVPRQAVVGRRPGPLAPHDAERERSVRTRTAPLLLLLVAVLGATSGCDSSTGVQRLSISGVIRTEGTTAGIGGAAVKVYFDDPGGGREFMTSATADAMGRYRLTVGPPPGYSLVNCSVLAIEASASGHVTQSVPLEWLVTVEECESGAVAVDLDLPVEPDSPAALATVLETVR